MDDIKMDAITRLRIIVENIPLLCQAFYFSSDLIVRSCGSLDVGLGPDDRPGNEED